MTDCAESTHWLPRGKKAAIVFSIDDIHPGRAIDGYDGGGDLGQGALGQVTWLLERHPQLWVTLFTTADWRETSPKPARLARHIPILRHHVYLAKQHPRGTMRLDRHPDFVEYLRQMPRSEIGLHGLHHVHRGPTMLIEFQKQSKNDCKRILSEAMTIFDAAGLPFVRGMTPPGWNAPDALLQAMGDLGFDFLCSARDIITPISPRAVTAMSGLRGVSLVYPERLAAGPVVHITANFQATSRPERAFEILDAGGVLHIKAHIVKNAYGHIALDGVDALYMNYLDTLLTVLAQRNGDQLWWTSLGQVAQALLSGGRNAAGRYEP